MLRRPITLTTDSYVWYVRLEVRTSITDFDNENGSEYK